MGADPEPDLGALGRDELESLYLAPGELRLPAGVFVGTHLTWLHPLGKHPGWRIVEAPFFAHLPWGVDFERRKWFWFRRRLAVGHFEARIGPSRWRETDTIRLTYDDRWLPGWANALLYDEIKPLSDDLCLGIGGISGGPGQGDHFFFALRRRR